MKTEHIITLPIPVAGGWDNYEEDSSEFEVQITEVYSLDSIVYYVVAGPKFCVYNCINECFTSEQGYDPKAIIAHCSLIAIM